MAMKKGILFTFLSILLSMFFILLLTPATDFVEKYRSELLRTRVSVLDEYIVGYEDYSEEVLNLVSLKALDGMTRHLHNKDRFLSVPFEEAFRDCARNGIIEGVTCPGMQDNTLVDWFNRLEEISEDNLNLNTSYTIHDLSVSQQLPFDIDVFLNISFAIWDSYASFETEKMIHTVVNIEGLYDPLYVVLGDDYNIDYNNTIRRSPVIDEGLWNVELLFDFYNFTEYRYTRNGTSFINRFEGVFLQSECCGIESLINPNRSTIFPNDDADSFNNSYVDYLYFQDYEFECTRVWRVQTANPDFNDCFKLDASHLVTFNVSSADWGASCSSTRCS